MNYPPPSSRTLRSDGGAVSPVPAVSVLLPTLNAADHLDRALRSIDRQSYPTIEIVAVDDGSTDETLSILKNFEWSVGRTLTLIERDDVDGSLAAALNCGLAAADGEFIARQDADDWSAPDRLARQVDHLHRYPEADLVGTGCHIHEADGSRRSQRHVLRTVTASDLEDKNQLVHGSVMARKSVLEEVGGYDERWSASEDYELWTRLAAGGYTLHNLDVPLYHLRLHDDSAYADAIHKSKLYGRLAAKRLQGYIDDEVAGWLAGEGPKAISDSFPPADQRAIKAEISQDLLRYGKSGRSVRLALSALSSNPVNVKSIGCLTLAVLPDSVTRNVINVVRARQNAAVQSANATQSARASFEATGTVEEPADGPVRTAAGGS